MGYQISIRKCRRHSLVQKKIAIEEFEDAVFGDEELHWLEETIFFNKEIEMMYGKRSTAIWIKDNLSLWFTLNEYGTIDLGCRNYRDVQTTPQMKKIIEIADKLKCYVEGDDDMLFYSPEAS